MPTHLTLRIHEQGKERRTPNKPKRKDKKKRGGETALAYELKAIVAFPRHSLQVQLGLASHATNHTTPPPAQHPSRLSKLLDSNSRALRPLEPSHSRRPGTPVGTTYALACALLLQVSSNLTLHCARTAPQQLHVHSASRSLSRLLFHPRPRHHQTRVPLTVPFSSFQPASYQPRPTIDLLRLRRPLPPSGPGPSIPSGPIPTGPWTYTIGIYKPPFA